MAKSRQLIYSKAPQVTVISGRCSLCYRPFDVSVGQHETLSAANERLLASFDAHVCNEDVNPNARADRQRRRQNTENPHSAIRRALQRIAALCKVSEIRSVHRLLSQSRQDQPLLTLCLP